MALDIIEGKFIKIGKSCKDIENDVVNLTGYVRISSRDNTGKYSDGYVFLENGNIIGYYYVSGSKTLAGKNAKEIVEKMKENGDMYEIYEYTPDKLSVMKSTIKEIFDIDNKKIINKPSPKVESVKQVEVIDYDGYISTSLDIIEGIPVKMGTNINEYKTYLKGYKLVDVFNKDKGYRRGYIVYDNDEPILIGYEDDRGALFGETAKLKVEKLLKNQNSIIDVYEYDTNKINMLLDYYPQMNLKSNSPENTDQNNDENMDIEKYVDKLIQNKTKTKNKTKNDGQEENLSKEELMKKLGIHAPDEKTIDTFIENLSKPTSEELEYLSNEIKKKIENILMYENNIEEYKLDVKVKYEGRYICKYDLKIKPKKKLGFVKKKVNIPYLKDKISTTIKNNYELYDMNIVSNIMEI